MQIRAVLAALLICAPAGAQTVKGTVFDSVANRPLAGARVTIADVRDPAASAHSTSTDSVGRYAFAGIASGTWLIGFLHPTLDSLGIEPITRRVTISADMTVDLAVPSSRVVHDMFCRTSGDTTGALIGHLRDAVTGNAVDSGKVIAQWSVIAFSGGQLARSLPTYAVATNAEGWFAFCGLPAQTTIALQGVHGADSSGSVMLEVPSHGIAHRELFAAKVDLVALAPVVDSTHGDSAVVEHVRRGIGRVTGLARDASSGKPLAGVQVTVEGTGLTATANADGMFTLANLPLGTHTLLSRKVGYVPDERSIDLLADGATRAEPSLVTIKALLDTVKIVGKRVFNSDHGGFAKRQQSGLGKFFGPDDIDKMHPLETSDVFRRVLSVHVEQQGFDKVLRMRGLTKGSCAPAVFVDGFQYRSFTASDLDNMVKPDVVSGIEIYTSSASAPAQFSNPFSDCGSIVIWTKR